MILVKKGEIDDLKAEERENCEELMCPFCKCKEIGFDAPGLKTHLLHGDCEQFNQAEQIKRLF